MKKHKYQFYEEIASGCYLHYNSLSNLFLVLNEKKHLLYENCPVNELEQNDSQLYNRLKDNGFLVDDDFDEYAYVMKYKNDMIFNTSHYNVTVNTTLDCNLNCWYCYENRIAGSKLSAEVIEAIKRNIISRHQNKPFQILKFTFFGGEPFLYYKGIKELLDFGKNFCEQYDIELIADFTTNATLITQECIDYIKQFQCHFQITLDGNRERHNKIKVERDKNTDTYGKTIAALKMINEHIPNRWVAVRINFDNQTLRNVREIIEDIKFLDRKKTCVIVKKVWQLKTEQVDREALMNAIQSLFDNKFLVDYYFMPKGCVCFAERESQVLFNYDGKIFKCTTLPTFDDEHALGKLDFEKGEIAWYPEKYKDWFDDMQPEHCKNCKWFPVCLGPCNRQLMAHQGEKICTFDASSLTQKEYLMYLFKYNLLKDEIYKEP